MIDKYTVETEYLDERVADRYLKRKSFTGIYGAYKQYRETSAVRQALTLCSPNTKFLDAPCGFGRWFGELSKNNREVVGVDISESMIKAAERNLNNNENVEVYVDNVRNLNFKNRHFDYVFSFALFKHLPNTVKIEVLSEFKRVSKKRIIVSIPVFGTWSKLFWNIRGRKGFPISEKNLTMICNELDLQIVFRKKIGIPVLGLEYMYVLEQHL